MLTELSQQLSSSEALVIGASAGATRALAELLPAVPKGARIPLVVVVHLSPNRPSLLPELFGSRCAARVMEPEEAKQMPRAAIAPANPQIIGSLPEIAQLIRHATLPVQGPS